MNTINKTSLSQLIQLKKEGKISEENVSEFLAAIKQDSGAVTNTVSKMAGEKESAESLLTNASASSAFTGKQECVLSIIKASNNISYDIDFTSANINQTLCRRLMKFILAIVISEEETDITEESVETALKTLDIPIFFDFSLNNMLGIFLRFVNKVATAKQPLYLIDARSRWAPAMGTRNPMSCGEIPCDFSVTPSTLGGQAVSEAYLSFAIFGARYQIWATISQDNSRVYNMKVRTTSK